METDEFFAQKHVWCLGHNISTNIFFLFAEGRIGLDGSLMVALGISTSVSVSCLYVLLLEHSADGSV